MAEVAIEIGGRSYTVSCRDGEEAQLRALARMIDERVARVKGSAPGINETRQFLFASLLLADELNDIRAGKVAIMTPPPPPPVDDGAETEMRLALETLAERLENAAERLAAVASAP